MLIRTLAVFWFCLCNGMIITDTSASRAEQIKEIVCNLLSSGMPIEKFDKDIIRKLYKQNLYIENMNSRQISTMCTKKNLNNKIDSPRKIEEKVKEKLNQFFNKGKLHRSTSATVLNGDTKHRIANQPHTLRNIPNRRKSDQNTMNYKQNNKSRATLQNWLTKFANTMEGNNYLKSIKNHRTKNENSPNLMVGTKVVDLVNMIQTVNIHSKSKIPPYSSNNRSIDHSILNKYLNDLSTENSRINVFIINDQKAPAIISTNENRDRETGKHLNFALGDAPKKNNMDLNNNDSKHTLLSTKSVLQKSYRKPVGRKIKTFIRRDKNKKNEDNLTSSELAKILNDDEVDEKGLKSEFISIPNEELGEQSEYNFINSKFSQGTSINSQTDNTSVLESDKKIINKGGDYIESSQNFDQSLNNKQMYEFREENEVNANQDDVNKDYISINDIRLKKGPTERYANKPKYVRENNNTRRQNVKYNNPARIESSINKKMTKYKKQPYNIQEKLQTEDNINKYDEKQKQTFQQTYSNGHNEMQMNYSNNIPNKPSNEKKHRNYEIQDFLSEIPLFTIISENYQERNEPVTEQFERIPMDLPPYVIPSKLLKKSSNESSNNLKKSQFLDYENVATIHIQKAKSIDPLSKKFIVDLTLDKQYTPNSLKLDNNKTSLRNRQSDTTKTKKNGRIVNTPLHIITTERINKTFVNDNVSNDIINKIKIMVLDELKNNYTAVTKGLTVAAAGQTVTEKNTHKNISTTVKPADVLNVFKQDILNTLKGFLSNATNMIVKNQPKQSHKTYQAYAPSMDKPNIIQTFAPIENFLPPQIIPKVVYNENPSRRLIPVSKMTQQNVNSNFEVPITTNVNQVPPLAVPIKLTKKEKELQLHNLMENRNIHVENPPRHDITYTWQENNEVHHPWEANEIQNNRKITKTVSFKPTEKIHGEMDFFYDINTDPNFKIQTQEIKTRKNTDAPLNDLIVTQDKVNAMLEKYISHQDIEKKDSVEIL